MTTKTLDQAKVRADIKGLLKQFENSQWSFKPDFSSIANLPIMKREELRTLKMDKGLYVSGTSGSTGEPVFVEKSYSDYIWSLALTIREYKWKNWDFAKDAAIIKVGAEEMDKDSRGIPREIVPIQGKTFITGIKSTSEIQRWLEEKNPHYIHCFPSIFSQLDLTKIPNFLDWRGTSELGGTSYSSEECGIIAIQCPDNKSNYHVMENQLVEVENDGSMIISTMSNPYIRRYKHGDHIELGKCTCNRTLQTITKIYGRVRNMFILPNGDTKWPAIGSRYYSQFGIKRYKAIQTDIGKIELQIISDPLNEREEELKKLVIHWLESEVEISIKYVNDFPNYKFEEFVSLVK